MANSTQRVTGAQLTGFTELRTALRKLPEEMEQRVLTEAVEAGGRVVLRAAVAIVARQTGALANALRIVVTKGRRGGREAKSRVGIDKKYRLNGRRPVRYAHQIEFGHRGKKGFVAPKPFLRPAVSANKPRIMRAIEQTLKSGIARAVRNVARK